MREFLLNKCTPSDVKDAMYASSHSWLEPIEKALKDFGVAHEAMIQQNTLGWRHFIRGCFINRMIWINARTMGSASVGYRLEIYL